MTAPAEAAARFGWGFLLGMGLGLVYGFLRPVRRRACAVADLLFICVAFWVWLQLSFAVCRGDIRPGTTAALGLGAVCWELTAGRLLRTPFRLFWAGIGGMFSMISYPFQKIFQFILKICKKVFASAKKRGTIYWSKRRHRRRRSGGNQDEQADQSLF